MVHARLHTHLHFAQVQRRVVALLADVLADTFVGPDRRCDCRSSYHDQWLLFARLTNLLSDGDGLRMAFDWKGASSLKPCFKHYNVFKKDTLCLLLLLLLLLFPLLETPQFKPSAASSGCPLHIAGVRCSQI
jgi:hypothetical protein